MRCFGILTDSKNHLFNHLVKNKHKNMIINSFTADICGYEFIPVLMLCTRHLFGAKSYLASSKTINGNIKCDGHEITSPAVIENRKKKTLKNHNCGGHTLNVGFDS